MKAGAVDYEQNDASKLWASAYSSVVADGHPRERMRLHDYKPAYTVQCRRADRRVRTDLRIETDRPDDVVARRQTQDELTALTGSRPRHNSAVGNDFQRSDWQGIIRAVWTRRPSAQRPDDHPTPDPRVGGRAWPQREDAHRNQNQPRRGNGRLRSSSHGLSLTPILTQRIRPHFQANSKRRRRPP